MESAKLSALRNVLSHFERMRNDNTLYRIIFEERDSRQHGIGNPEAKAILLEAAITELKRQISNEL